MMSDASMVLTTDRFERLRRIDWWNQELLGQARVLVIGAGALGNEVIKNLSLLGVGHLAIVDMDRIEESNLCRSVLFRAEDEGRCKAEAAAAAAAKLYPEIDATALVGNVLGDIGLGWFRGADVVVGALDNREARVFVNSACAQTGRPWIDGGIEVLNGIVRGFEPPDTACYECTMGEKDWDELNRRRSCSLLARTAIAAGGTPTTPTTASIIGAMQAQEVVKRLHGLPSLAGSGFVFEGLGHASYAVEFPIHADCPWHEPPAPVEYVPEFGPQTRIGEIWEHAQRRLQGLDALDLAREMVTALECETCHDRQDAFVPITRISASEAVCSRCGTERVPRLTHSISGEQAWLHMTVGDFGLPPRDVVWARKGETMLGFELASG